VLRTIITRAVSVADVVALWLLATATPKTASGQGSVFPRVSDSQPFFVFPGS
jgi:hypothetical protein